MHSDNRLAVIVFLGLIGLIALALGGAWLRDELRPTIAEVRIVTASDLDPVFRDGPRHATAAESLQIAAAVRVERLGRPDRWLAPVERLSLDGAPVDHLSSDRWSDDDRRLRVFWFTVECVNVGGDLTASSAGRRLQYRTFLAPEMGRGLLAERFPEAHNDDHLGLAPGGAAATVGTLRLYVRIEVFDPDEELRTLDAGTSIEPGPVIPGPDYPAIHRALEPIEGIDAAVGELFLLPGFEPDAEPSGDWREVTRPALGVGFDELVDRRIVASSRTFAAVAATGEPFLDSDRLRRLGRIELGSGRPRLDGAVPRWQLEVRAGDLLDAGDRWLVLARDDGDGVLDGDDEVLVCWRRPAARSTLAEQIGDRVMELELWRHER